MPPEKSDQQSFPTSINRRTFIRSVGWVAAASSFTGCAAPRPRTISANEKLNVAVIGVAGQGRYSIDNLKDQNIVALCDVDSVNLGKAASQFPSAKTYRDFRRLIDQNGIDAIVVATPDHTHAVATGAALRSGRHVYCEKPLTHTVSEARAITNLAAKTGLVTQIGTQIHAGNNYRRVVELVQSGSIGEVREVHVWVASSYGGQPARPQGSPQVPEHLDWEGWLGPVSARPYHPDYVPHQWRNWWAFGGGSLADFGCHFMDLPYWALHLKHVSSVEPLAGPPVNSDSTPPWMIVRYQFPQRQDSTHALPAVALTWYHGGKRPEMVSDEMFAKWKNGVLFVGDKGMLLSDYGRHVLLPEEKFKDFQRPPESIPNSIGHHKEWVNAIKTGGKTTCPFSYSGPLTETALLGNVAYRVGKRLDWDAKNLRATNCPEADALIQHQYRRGWRI